jgi:tRNA (guanine9-N1)-methyltransferase
MDMTEHGIGDRGEVSLQLEDSDGKPNCVEDNKSDPSTENDEHSNLNLSLGVDNESEEHGKRKIECPSDEESLESKKQRWSDLCQGIEVPPELSKRQKKRYIRNVLWETKWKLAKRAREKEKLKQKKIQAKLENKSLGPSRKMLKNSTMANSSCKLRVALDFSYDNLMSDVDIGKCLKQLGSCYCLNRRATNPLQFYVTNFSGKAKEQFARTTPYDKWDVNFHEANHMDVFPKEDLIYLTSDSDNVLSTLDHSKVYVIGALVDHNRYKNHTLNVAIRQGIQHAQLPIGEYLEMKSRKVLTINHVFEILIHASEGISWKDAFLRVIPQRKGAVEKTQT